MVAIVEKNIPVKVSNPSFFKGNFFNILDNLSINSNFLPKNKFKNENENQNNLSDLENNGIEIISNYVDSPENIKTFANIDGKGGLLLNLYGEKENFYDKTELKTEKGEKINFGILTTIRKDPNSSIYILSKDYKLYKYLFGNKVREITNLREFPALDFIAKNKEKVQEKIKNIDFYSFNNSFYNTLKNEFYLNEFYTIGNGYVKQKKDGFGERNIYFFRKPKEIKINFYGEKIDNPPELELVFENLRKKISFQNLDVYKNFILNLPEDTKFVYSKEDKAYFKPDQNQTTQIIEKLETLKTDTWLNFSYNDAFLCF